MVRIAFVVGMAALGALLVSTAGSAASSSVKVTFRCDGGIRNGSAQVWLLRSVPATFDELTSSAVGHTMLACGRAQSSSKDKKVLSASAPFSYVHVEFGANACGPAGCRYVCINGYPGLGFFPTLPLEASCTVQNGGARPPSVTLSVK